MLYAICIGQVALGQNHGKSLSECDGFNWKYDFIENPTEVDSALILIECLVNQNNYPIAMELLDSLIAENATDASLFMVRANYRWKHDACDTIYIEDLFKALSFGGDSSINLYNIGVHYYNYIIACDDSSGAMKPSTEDKLKLLKRAESIVKEAAAYDSSLVGFYYEFMFMTWELKTKITGVELNPISLDEKFDTLLLMAQLRDCGEFGGHMEYIKCYYSDGKLVGRFWKDPPLCIGNFTPEEKEGHEIFKNSLQTINFDLLNTYFQHVTTIVNPYLEATNSPTSFWVIKDDRPFFVRDWIGNSKEYEVFRNATFKE